MIELITSLLDNKITLESFINFIKNNHYDFNEDALCNLLDNNQNEEQSSIVYLLLYFVYKYSFFHQNDFLMFLDSIKYETDNDFSKDIIYIYNKENIAIFKIDHIYFIINNNDENININLPHDLQNDYQFCINCNHELYFGKTLMLESFEFYLISDVK